VQFKDILGQEETKRQLIQEANSGKVRHAQLFLGKLGHGNLPLALAYSQYVLCTNKNEKDSCGECSSCKMTHQLAHPDLHFSFPVVQAIDKKSDAFLPQFRKAVVETGGYFSLNQWVNFIDDKGRVPIIGAEESLEIIKKLSLKSFEGGFKIMIIWMASEMNTSCANKLLKILEEPPANTIFLLLCDSPEKLLATIVSRTQMVKIPRLQNEQITTALQQAYGKDLSTSKSIAGRADGDWIEASELVGTHEEKDEHREHFVELMRSCYMKDVLKMITWAEKVAGETREYQKTFLRYSLHMFRMSILKNFTDDQLLNVSDEEDAFLQKFAKFITGNNITELMKSFDSAHYNIERNANPKILFTEICFNVMRYIHAA
jgi:DNA polymerase III subunit delta'